MWTKPSKSSRRLHYVLPAQPKFTLNISWLSSNLLLLCILCSVCRPLHGAYGNMWIKLSKRRDLNRERQPAHWQRSRRQRAGQVINHFQWHQSSRWELVKHCMHGWFCNDFAPVFPWMARRWWAANTLDVGEVFFDFTLSSEWLILVLR